MERVIFGRETALAGVEALGAKRALVPAPPSLATKTELATRDWCPLLIHRVGKTCHGKITSGGDRWLRWALVEAVVPASYGDAETKEGLETLRVEQRANVAKLY